MGTRTNRYPTIKEIQNLSAQELVDRGIVALAPASFGQVDTRPAK